MPTTNNIANNILRLLVRAILQMLTIIFHVVILRPIQKTFALFCSGLVEPAIFTPHAVPPFRDGASRNPRRRKTSD